MPISSRSIEGSNPAPPGDGASDLTKKSPNNFIMLAVDDEELEDDLDDCGDAV